MTNKTDITRQIEERLGSEGSPQMAVEMFDALEAVGAISFDAFHGFRFVGEDRERDDFPAWDAALDYVSGAPPMTTPKNPAAVCACHDDPMHSKCGDWRDNTSACICVDYGLQGQLPP